MKKLSASAQQALQDRLGYTFQNVPLLARALTLANAGQPAQYERLEFLGDRVLGLSLAFLLEKQYPDEKEGVLAKRLAVLASQDSLFQIAQDIQLGDYVLTGDDHLRSNASVLSDVVEALLAAVFLDGSFPQALACVQRLFGNRLALSVPSPADPKTALQEWTMKHKLPLPVYSVIERTGPDHAPNFTLQLIIEGYAPLIAQGTSKKAAEQTLAQTFLKEHIK